MREAIQFYAPDWELVFIWIAITVPVCLTVLFFAYPRGVRGAAITVAVILGLWFGTLLVLRVLAIWYLTAYGIFLVGAVMFTPPVVVGSALGFLSAWGFWGRWPHKTG